MTLLFQGLIKVPLGCFCKAAGETNKRAYRYVTRIDISLLNLFLAMYTTTDRQGGPYFSRQSSPKCKIQFPTEWWRWAWIKMMPYFGQGRSTGVLPDFSSSESVIQWFSRWQLFKHVKTTLAVLNTADGPSTESGPFKMTSILASLLTQDTYFLQEHKGSDPDPSNVNYYLTFGQLTAFGAPWCFPPGQRASKSGLFNHHSMTGSNDPLADPWQPLVPNAEQVDQADYELVSQFKRIIGQLHLALFFSLTPTGTMATGAGQAFSEEIENTWALIRIKSKWLLGNVRPWPRMNVTWYTPGQGQEDETMLF